MGPRARQTRLQWNWSTFRFETLFTVPEIIRWDGGEEGDVELVTGSADSRERTFAETMSGEAPRMYRVAPISPDQGKPVYGFTASLGGEMVC